MSRERNQIQVLNKDISGSINKAKRQKKIDIINLQPFGYAQLMIQKIISNPPKAIVDEYS